MVGVFKHFKKPSGPENAVSIVSHVYCPNINPDPLHLTDTLKTGNAQSH